MPEKNKKLIQRLTHGAAAVTVNSNCVEVILFGGWKELLGSYIADPVVLRLGECIRELGVEVIRMTAGHTTPSYKEVRNLFKLNCSLFLNEWLACVYED